MALIKSFEDDECVVDALVETFIGQFSPLESASFHLLRDRRTGAVFAECHIKGDQILALGTIDVPLDPEHSPDYRANRELVENHPAFMQMKSDALAGRSFSGIVCEFVDADEQPPRLLRTLLCGSASEPKVNFRTNLSIVY